MREHYIAQGEDINVELTIYNPSGIALNMGGADGIAVHLVDGYGTVRASFGTSETYGMDLTDAASGVLKFKILTEVTNALEPGLYYYKYEIEYPDGAYTDDSHYTVKKYPEYAFSVKKY
jgi:hypothetical protein